MESKKLWLELFSSYCCQLRIWCGTPQPLWRHTVYSLKQFSLEVGQC